MTTRIIPVTRRDDITFHPDGRIDLTAHVANVLDIHAGDVINIACRDEGITEYYLYVARRADDTVGRHACTCRPAKNKGRYLRAHSKRLTDFILSILHVADTARLRVGSPEQLPTLGLALPIIIR